MLAKPLIEHSKILKYFKEINDIQKNKIFTQYVESISDLNWSISKKTRHCEAFKDIILNNDNDYFELFKKYKDKNISLEEKKNIRYGKNGYKKYTDKLKLKRKGQDRSHVVSAFHIEYYIKKGMNIEEAHLALKNLRKKSFDARNYSARLLPNQNDYWMNKGYNLEEAEELRKPFVEKSAVSLQNYIKKYGEEEGKTKFLITMEKRKLTNIERTGYPYPFKGSVSKESLKFFLPLYKKIRKLGINRDDIYWGIKGSKEYVINDADFKKIYFIDFTIKSLKIAIEYNNDYWHPHPDIEWRGLGLKEDRMAYDEAKKNSILNKNFDLYYVWSFENLSLKLEELYKIIKEKYDTRRKMFSKCFTND